MPDDCYVCTRMWNGLSHGSGTSLCRRAQRQSDAGLLEMFTIPYEKNHVSNLHKNHVQRNGEIMIRDAMHEFNMTSSSL